MAKMKVYGYRNYTGRMVVAAPSKKLAAESFGVSLHTFNQFGGVTGNAAEIESAMSRPGLVFRNTRESFPSRTEDYTCLNTGWAMDLQ